MECALMQPMDFSQPKFLDMSCFYQSFFHVCRFISEYRFDISKLEPLVAKVCDAMTQIYLVFLVSYNKGNLFSACVTNYVIYFPHLALYLIFIHYFAFPNALFDKSILQPHSPDNRALARECKDVKIDRVYIGSCTGGKTEDFLAAARVFLASVRLLSYSITIQLLSLHI